MFWPQYIGQVRIWLLLHVFYYSRVIPLKVQNGRFVWFLCSNFSFPLTNVLWSYTMFFTTINGSSWNLVNIPVMIWDLCQFSLAGNRASITDTHILPFFFLSILVIFFLFINSAYNVLVNCVHSLIEENTEKMCKRSSLDTWLPFIISVYINVTSEEIQACNGK